MFTSVLVGVDRSEHAKAALKEAIDIARTQHAALTVLVAYDTVMSWGPVSPLPQSLTTTSSPAAVAKPRPFPTS